MRNFCGLMGWKKSELLNFSDEKDPIGKPVDFLSLNIAKEVKQEFNTHKLELKHTLKPVSLREKKKINKVIYPPKPFLRGSMNLK